MAVLLGLGIITLRLIGSAGEMSMPNVELWAAVALLGCYLRTVLYTVLKTCSTHLQVVNVAEGVHYLLPIPDFREHKRDRLSSGNRQDHGTG
jgi:hypothetical protein